MGLAAWLLGHGAAAQDRTWDEALSSAGPHWRHDNPRARADDPDLVRPGDHPTWRETLAEGATATSQGALDLDGDGVAERLLTVTPRADPYPYNRVPGVVLVRHVRAGFRAFVLLREQEEAWWRLAWWRGRPVFMIEWAWSEGHASDGFIHYTARYLFRLGRDGVLRRVAVLASEPHWDR